MQQFEIIVLCKYNMHPMQVYSSKQRLVYDTILIADDIRNSSWTTILRNLVRP